MLATLSGWKADAIWSTARQVECLRRRLPRHGRPAGRSARPSPRRPAHHLPEPGSAGELLAITFDDGPDPAWTPQILDVLARHQVRATFFLIGDRVLAHPRIAERITMAGHSVGNHSMHHPQPFAPLSSSRIRQEIRQGQDVIAQVTGTAPRLFRAPAGNWSAAVLRQAEDAGLRAVDWSVDPKDWRAPPPGRIVRALLRSRDGDVLLCHDGGGDRSATVRAVDLALAALLDRGAEFAALDTD
jgi:peptidoglycan/xylan/chitin deacetylase (PgdA/CDA1 family)